MSWGVSIRPLSASARKNLSWKQKCATSFAADNLGTSSAKTEGYPEALKFFSLVSVYFEFSIFCHEVRSTMVAS